MPVYATPQAGGNANPALNIAALSPGDAYQLFSGSETPGNAPFASVAIARATSPSGSDQGVTFQIEFPQPAPNATVVIQGSNVDDGVTGAAYETIYTSTNKQFDGYTDTGRWTYYRAQLSAYVSGGMPTVIAQR